MAAESDDSEEEPPARTLISSREALDQVKNLFVYLAWLQKDTSMLDTASRLRELVEAHLRQAATARQKMHDFFMQD